MPDYSSHLDQIINALNHLAPTELNQYVNFISAIAATLAAFAGLWAAWAASRSAQTAKQAAEGVQKIARLEILRDASSTASEVIAEYERVKSLVDEVKNQIKDLATHSGQGAKSSVVKEVIEKAESKQKAIMSLQEEAQELVQKRSTLMDASEADLMRELTKFGGYLTKARRFRYQLEREADSLIAQNQAYFSKAIGM
jgi:hypothetical protein